MALATVVPRSSTTSASAKATRDPPLTTVAVHSRTEPTRTGARKLVFISTFDEITLRPCPRAKVTVADPMAESAIAPTNPPWTMPAGLANRSSASIRQTVRPGFALSTQVMPRVSSQLGGTWIRWSATRSRYPGAIGRYWGNDRTS